MPVDCRSCSRGNCRLHTYRFYLSRTKRHAQSGFRPRNAPKLPEPAVGEEIMTTTSLLDNIVSSWFSARMIQDLTHAALFTGEIGILDGSAHLYETAREEPMTQMQPKELLVHLEKGDRTEEFLEGEGAPRNPYGDGAPFPRNSFGLEPAMMNEAEAIRSQMNSLNQYAQGIGMASAGMLSTARGGPRW